MVRLLGDDLRYVSRGGLKLEAALKHWEIDLTGRVCADVGASTGGFTDCMLQHGAARVLAIDTGYGQIAHKLRVDPRVTLMERTNARLLKPANWSRRPDYVSARWMFRLSRRLWCCRRWWQRWCEGDADGRRWFW